MSSDTLMFVFAGIITTVILSLIAWGSAEHVIVAIKLLRKERYQEKMRHLRAQRKLHKARLREEKQKKLDKNPRKDKDSNPPP